VTGSGQKQFVASLDKNNDRWSQTRKMEQTALGTFLRSFCGFYFQRNSTSAAKPVGPIPIDDLNCPGCNPEQVFIQTTINLAQPLKGHSCWRNRSFGYFGSITRLIVESAQVVLR
jgi:hypothetical protein